MQPIKFYGKCASANPFKVEVFLKELNLPYESVLIPFSDVKKPYYVAINPNGRLPAIHDPNTGITLWESGAIIEYLIEQYDKDERRLSFAPGSTEAYHAKQWLYFQVSGQGPYYGQFGWFVKFHAEKIPSAIERYVGEINRVSGVLDTWLAKQQQEFADADPTANGPWLVGNRLSYADLAFVRWHMIVGMFATKEQFNEDNYPYLKAWIAKMVARESVQQTIQENPSGE